MIQGQQGQDGAAKKTTKQAEQFQARLSDAKLRPCEYCHELDGVKLRKNIAGSGVVQWCWYCETCQRFARRESIWIKHDVIEEWVSRGWLKDPGQVRVLRDYSQDYRCAICGQPGAELHHYAPQALAEFFGDEWQRWPTGYLCRAHHAQWHGVVTFYMRPFPPHEQMIERYGSKHERV